jgi:hypothetical protein
MLIIPTPMKVKIEGEFVTGHSLRRSIFSVRFGVHKFERWRNFLREIQLYWANYALARLLPGDGTV